MKINLDCISCFIRQALDAARLATNDENIHKDVVKEVLQMAHQLDMSQSPPVMAQKIHRLIRELVGSNDPYYWAKKHFNNLALSLYPELREKVIRSKDPLQTAVKIAIAGNVMDFGPKSLVTESDIKQTIENSLSSFLDSLQIKSFRKSVYEAEKILYLADNAGEIVFDHLLIEQLPIDKLTLAVKGMPVINDATIEDADQIGLRRIIDVIDNGSDAPGTILETCSKTFIEQFEKADLIIAKGQGNYETLSTVDKNIFFMLKVKCPVIAKDIGFNVGETILYNKNINEKYEGQIHGYGKLSSSI